MNEFNYYPDIFSKTEDVKSSMMLEELRYAVKLVHMRLDLVDQKLKKLDDLYDLVLRAVIQNIESEHHAKEIQ